MKYVLWAVLAIVIIGGVVYFVMRNNNASTNTNTTTNIANNNVNTITPNLNIPDSNANSNSSANTNANTSLSKSVSIANMSFQPATLPVALNTTVTWTNNDSVTHTVTGTDFDSGNIAPGSSYSHTFTIVGTYNYHCAIHPSMAGSVTVQ